MPTGAPNRIVVRRVLPQVPGGHPVKRVEGEPVDVTATVVVDGHDELWVVLAHQAPETRGWTSVPMDSWNPGLDEWTGRFVPLQQGRHRFRVLAWVDHLASLTDLTVRKVAAGQDVTSELLQADALLAEVEAASSPRDAALLAAARARLAEGETVDLTDPGAPDRPSVAQLYRNRLRNADASASATVEVLVERERAAFSAWYELFPRSVVGRSGVHGTLTDVAARVGDIADMGFDVLYLPPIHPIGDAFRKGPDNAPEAGPGDPGSPWAIGSEAGGHTAVHPELGTIDDVAALARTSRENGLELALDLAFQCSPDHPWVAEHPEWFRHRPDGSIQYAENPPKKYQDIYPLDFESPAWRELWDALLAVVEHWMDAGVTVFRVDNPHTKPFAFWEWLISRVHDRDPGVIFLAEAFTRPEVMHELGRRGFTQSYTYFTWRSSKSDLVEYATEVSTSPSADEFRPNFWPTTPDILPWELQGAPLEAFAVRHLLAATLSASYGIYGPAFEVGDNTPAGNGKEEYGRSEKYEIRDWDLTTVRTLRSQVTALNRIRNEQLALHTTRTLRIHASGNEQILAYSKTAHDGPDPDPDQPARNPVLCVVNLDPTAGQTDVLDLDLVALGVDPSRPYQVHDLLLDQRFTWHGHHPYVELHPADQPGHVFRVSQPPDGAAPVPTPPTPSA